jgi:hypothetical protein
MPLCFQGEFGMDVSLFTALWLGSSCAHTPPLNAIAAATSATVRSVFIVAFSLVK